MKRRVFVAINLPEDLKEELFRFQEEWPSLPCRWVKKENLHLTLIFLGYLREEKLADVLKTTKDVAKKSRPFSIYLNKISYGPGEKKFPPRLVWVTGERSEDLIKLKRELEDSLSGKVPFIREKREFLPHITLGRIRKWDWRRTGPGGKPEIDTEVSFDFEVNSIEVMESHLKRTGPEYTTLLSAELIAGKSQILNPESQTNSKSR